MFMMNLSAPFLPKFYKDNMDAAAPYWDILFGKGRERLITPILTHFSR